MQLWKEQIHRSQYLKDYYKGKKERVNHPVFGDRKDGLSQKCWDCGKETPMIKMIRSVRNGEVEYILCRECYAKRGINQKVAGNR